MAIKMMIDGQWETVVEDANISDKLDKSGGAMTGYLSDKTALQVRNVMTATEKPADSVGQDGDICFVIKA